MRMVINPEWKKRIRGLLDDPAIPEIDEVISFSKSATWLVEELTRRGRMFKIYNAGAGVKRITTNTDICPCCKRKL